MLHRSHAVLIDRPDCIRRCSIFPIIEHFCLTLNLRLFLGRSVGAVRRLCSRGRVQLIFQFGFHDKVPNGRKPTRESMKRVGAHQKCTGTNNAPLFGAPTPPRHTVLLSPANRSCFSNLIVYKMSCILAKESL